jgi:hypothetical protein
MKSIFKNKNIFLIFFILISFSFKNDYLIHCNARFNFCISYPADFIKLPESENGDGRIFISKDKKTEIRMYGSLAIEDFDKLEQEFTTQTSHTHLSYKMINGDWFIFSGTDAKGNIVYQKTVKKKIDYMGEKNTYVFQTLTISYPPNQSKKYNSYCKLIAKSL